MAIFVSGVEGNDRDVGIRNIPSLDLSIIPDACQAPFGLTLTIGIYVNGTIRLGHVDIDEGTSRHVIFEEDELNRLLSRRGFVPLD